MVRFGLPVGAADGAGQGLITINYSGRALLDRLAQLVMPEADIGVWVLDAEGYWLLGERPDEAWAFEFAASGEGARFADRHGPAWALLQGAEPGVTGQAEIGGDLYAWRRVLPVAVNDRWRLNGPGTQGWLLVSRTPRQAILAAAAGQHLALLGGFAALALAVLPGALALAHFQIGRRQNLGRLRASEARFREMLAAAPDAILILDEDGRIRLINARGEAWFGYSNEELVGRPAELLVPDRSRERYRQLREEYLSAPRVWSLDAHAGLAGRRRDGSEFAIELSLAPLINDEGAQVIAVLRDVTERRALERAREEAQARYRQLFDNLPLGVFRSSLSERLADDRRFLEVNPALVSLFEAGSAQRLLACPPAQLYADDQQRAALVAELFALGVVAGRELRMVTLNGRMFDARLSVVTRRDGDGNRFVDGVIEDISARCAAERDRDRAAEEVRRKATALETANRELEAFSYSVSHDLRAPLRAMDGFSRILEQEYGERLDAAGRDYLGRVRGAAQHMAALIDDLLKLARVARSELQPGPVDLSGLAAELAATLDERESKRELRWHIEPGLVARGDTRLLRVALDNLFDNAWKFTRGRSLAQVQFGSCSEGGEVAYYVRDNGVGFDMAYAGKLFGAFQRLHDASQFPGTGVGLATAQRVIHKHGGRIWVEAAEGQGATFYFTLGMQEAA
jgi:PAS domain S-box-containing protein